METWQAILTAVLSALGAGGLATTGTKFWLQRNKQDDDARITDEIQATKTQQVLIEHQGIRIEKLEVGLAECMKSHVEEARKSGMNEGQITQLTATTATQSKLILEGNATIANLQSQLHSLSQNATETAPLMTEKLNLLANVQRDVGSLHAKIDGAAKMSTDHHNELRELRHDYRNYAQTVEGRLAIVEDHLKIEKLK